MKFWDSSALVTLVLQQPRTNESRGVLEQDSEIVAWWGSAVECASAIARLYRDGQLSEPAEREARALLDALRLSWFEVQPGDAVREQALRLLRVHPLRSADALQLAAALEWAGAPPQGDFVTYDDRLRAAAVREGFSA